MEPVEPVPVEPIEPTPVEPVEPAPVEPVPVEPVPVEPVEPVSPIEPHVPPYAALYNSEDCTGEYFKIEFERNPYTDVYEELEIMGFKDARSITLGSWMGMRLYDGEFKNSDYQRVTGPGKDGDYICDKIDEEFIGELRSFDIYSWGGAEAVQLWNDFYDGP